MAKVTISDATVEVREGVSQRTNRPWKLRSQRGIFDNPKFRLPVEISLADKQPAYEVGEYMVDWENSVEVGDYGRVQIGRLVLVKGR